MTPAVPGILQTGLCRTRSLIIELLQSIMQNVYKFTAAAEAAIQNNFYTDCADGPRFHDVLWVIQMLVATRQQEIYIRYTICKFSKTYYSIISFYIFKG